MKQVLENVTLVCYADDNMKTSQQLCIRSAQEKAGIAYYQDYGPENIQADQGFYFRNMKTLEAEQRGGGKGFWLWKPYICYDVLQILNDNEHSQPQYLVYADSGIEFIGSIKPIIDEMEKTGQQIWLFGNNHTHMKWCKKKVLQSMLYNWFDIPNILEKEQVQASVIIFKVSDYTVDFARRWLAWSEIPGFIDDSDNIGISDYYREHRNDQSILTNLAIQDNIRLHWWPVQYGHVIRDRYPDDYGQLFYHHRWREQDWSHNGHTIESFMSQPKNI